MLDYKSAFHPERDPLLQAQLDSPREGKAVRAFPIQTPAANISLVGPSGHEVAWIAELAELPPHLLKDIGLTESDRFVESNKPFWRD